MNEPKNDLSLKDLEEMFPNPPDPRANKANDIIANVILALNSTLAGFLLMALIREYPERAVYNLWVLPDHKTIMKTAKINKWTYYHWLGILEKKNLIVKYYEKRFESMLYRVNFEELENYDGLVIAPTVG